MLFFWLNKVMNQTRPGSIRSSPRYGLSPPYGLTKEQCWTVPPCSYLEGRHAVGPGLVHPDAGF